MVRKTMWLLIVSLALLTACGQTAEPTTPAGRQIPSLALPEGANPHGGGGGGGSGGRQQNEGAGFEFSSDWSLEAVHRHFVGQLEAAGWQVRSEENGEIALVTSWDVFDEAGRTWAAKLIVEQTGATAPYEYQVDLEMLTA